MIIVEDVEDSRCGGRPRKLGRWKMKLPKKLEDVQQSHQRRTGRNPWHQGTPIQYLWMSGQKRSSWTNCSHALMWKQG